jgi:hypothetical protein
VTDGVCHFADRNRVDHARPLAVLVFVVVLSTALAGCSRDDREVAPARTPGATTGPQTSLPTAPDLAPDATAPPAAAEAPVDPLSPRPGLETAPPPGLPVCADDTLRVVDADTIVRLASVEQVYVVRTTGPDCQLEGHPEVTVLADGRPVPVEVTPDGPHVSARQPGPVTLSTTTSASFGLGTPRDGACTTASRVDVRLPGTQTVHRVASELQVCQGRLSLSAVSRSTDDES